MAYSHEPIRIDAIAPGAMITNLMNDSAIPDDLDFDLIMRYPGLRPSVDPAGVADTIVFMLSDATPCLHDGVLSADGGVTAG